MSDSTHSNQLKRDLGFFGATILGLASVIGVGIFVSLGIAAGISGYAVIGVLVIAGFLSACNSLNLTQLAVNHPVSGGIYEYGYKYLKPWLGFIGGWNYLIGKISVGATAALGFTGYFLRFTGLKRDFLVPIAEIAVFCLTLIILGGIRNSKRTALAIVSISILSLIFFIVIGLFTLSSKEFLHQSTISTNPTALVKNTLESIALMFVAYNGAARISVLGEEIVEPKKNIPKAIAVILSVTFLLYIGVAIVSLGSIGPEALGVAATEQKAPLEVVAESFHIPGGATILTVGAIAAMLSVLLSTILSLSRMLLAMGRRGDMPKFFTQLNDSGTTPYWAVTIAGIAIALLVLMGEVKTTWSFAAFTALCRGFIVGLAALRLNDDERLYPKWVTWLALFACLFLAFWVSWQVWLIGLGLIVIGLLWHYTAHHDFIVNPNLLDKNPKT